MQEFDEIRPDPDALLNALKKEEEHFRHGKLKVFFGMCAGAGKTYDMLKSAHEAQSKKIDVVIGYIETHKRPETEALIAGLPVIPRKKLEYRGVSLEEMDLDAILERKPQIVLVDELAHTNVPGSRHTRRYQDVLELLDNDIDVFTTLNVQHLESRAETVAQITGSIVRETVPDSIFEQANEVELIDISPEDLQKRLAEGKVYTPERSLHAVQNFFRKGNLTALREMSLRMTAERVDHQLRDYMQSKRITDTWKSGQRMMVGISPSPSTVSVIRWARRTAYTMDATWIAVYVETSKALNDEEKKQLNNNIKLAGELGAEIVTTADEHVARALIRVARQQNVTQILVGKTRRRFPFRPTLLDEIIENSGDLDVYAVGGETTDGTVKHPRRIVLPKIRSGIWQYTLAAAAVILAALACYPFTATFGYQTAALILLFTVVLLPLVLGVGPVLLAATLSALLWDYFFIPPRFTFSISLPQDYLLLIAYFVISTVTGVLTARIRAREHAVRLREERSTALFMLTKHLIAAKTQDEVAEAAVRNISSFFDSDVAVFLSQPDGDIFTAAHPRSTYAVNEKEFGVAAWTYWNEKKAGKFTDTLPATTATYYPVTGPRYPLGVIGVQAKNGKQFSIDQESLLQNFIAQIASTLEREQLSELAKRTVVYAESEKLYKTLFNSMSHELRTPIAAIVSASEGMLNLPEMHGSTLGKTLTDEIHTAAERLNRLVENLLDMTRLESGQLAPKKDWCDVRDIIQASFKKLQAELARHVVTLNVAEDMPLVQLDFGLIEQVCTNLLHNASLYTPAGAVIAIDASMYENELLLVIHDNGPGFPEEAQKKIFDKFYRVPGTRTGGTGLGLSIVRGFVEAHKGTITASNKPSGGAQFIIRIPVEIQQPMEIR